MPSSAIDSDSDDEQDSSLGLVMERNIVSSNASMEPLERLDALQRQNAELARKCMEAERTLQNRLGEHESELEEMQGKLEEMRSELSATKREEKELRSKEVNKFYIDYHNEHMLMQKFLLPETKYNTNISSRTRSIQSHESTRTLQINVYFSSTSISRTMCCIRKISFRSPSS